MMTGSRTVFGPYYSASISSQLANLILELEEGELREEDMRAAFECTSFSKTEAGLFANFSSEGYQRVRLFGNDKFDLLLLCWKSGQLSPIHDHSQSTCVVKVVSGTATEISYKRCGRNSLVPQYSEQLHTGSITSCAGPDIHQMGNLEPEGADLLTLHCYSPPLQGMQLFSLRETVFAEHDQFLMKPAFAQTPAVEMSQSKER